MTVENRFFSALMDMGDEGKDVLHRYLDDRQALRMRLMEVAYHEAGHVVGHVFTYDIVFWDEAGHIELVSILPHRGFMGRVRTQGPGPMPAIISEGLPPDLLRSAGYRYLMSLLGGIVAQTMWTDDLSCFDVFDWLDEEIDEDGSDGACVERVAKIMSKPGWPFHRVLDTAMRWTTEMLSLGEVRTYVESLVVKLLDVGDLEGPDLDSFIYDTPVLGLYKNLPRWRRRF